MSFRPQWLAATLSVALLAGCNAGALSNIGIKPAAKTSAATGAAKTGSKATTAFASTTALAAVTTTTEVTTSAEAKALAQSDATMVEDASATMETKEAAVTSQYSLESLDDGFGLTSNIAFGSGGNDRQQPQQQAGRQQQQQQQQQGRGGQQQGGFPGGPGQMGGGPMGGPGQPGGPEDQGPPQDDQGGPRPGVLPGGQAITFGVIGQLTQAVKAGGFTFSDCPHPPKLERQPPEPPRQIQWTQTVTIQLDQRRTQAAQQVKQNQAAKPAQSEDEALIAQVLDAQPWQSNADDDTTVQKSGTASLTLGTGLSRKIAVLRVVQKDAPHRLVQGNTDIADVFADGATKTIHWQKTMQADGSAAIVYHHEFVAKDGHKWVTDWEKAVAANGDVTGKGTFTETDASGASVSAETINIGGTDAATTTTATDDTTATTDTSTTTVDAAATTTATSTEAAAEAQEEASAATTP